MCYKRLGHPVSAVGCLKMTFYFFLRKGIFPFLNYSTFREHKFVCVDFCTFTYFTVKRGITFFCVLIYSHLEFSVLNCAVLPSLPNVSLKFVC